MRTIPEALCESYGGTRRGLRSSPAGQACRMNFLELQHNFESAEMPALPGALSPSLSQPTGLGRHAIPKAVGAGEDSKVICSAVYRESLSPRWSQGASARSCFTPR